VIAELEEEMTTASGKLEFERAALLRDQIEALKSGDYRKAAASSAKGKSRAYAKAKRRR
jgi:excinuclease ABC subunit B